MLWFEKNIDILEVNRRHLPGSYSTTRPLKYLPQQIWTQMQRAKAKIAFILFVNAQNSEFKLQEGMLQH